MNWRDLWDSVRAWLRAHIPPEIDDFWADDEEAK